MGGIVNSGRGLLPGCFLLILMFFAYPAHAAWLRAETPHFVIYGQSNEERLRSQALLLEDYHVLLRQLTGAPDDLSPRKLEIFMVRGREQMNRIRRVGASVGGFYVADPGGMLAVADESGREDWMSNNEILLHEYAHHFMLQHFPAAYPGWYVEGFAEYMATARLADDTIEFGRQNLIRASWLADRSGWLPLDRVLFGDRSRMTGAEVQKFYAQSWLTVHYLMRDAERRRHLSAYLVAVARGDDPRASFAAIFGITASRLQRDISAYGSSREMTFSRATRGSARAPVEVRVTRLPAASEELLLLRAAMSRGQYGTAPGFLARVRREAASHADDPFARRVLAMAEAYYGDGATADVLLDGLLERAPDDVELLYLKGVRYLREGRFDEANRIDLFRQAQRHFVRAHRADEDHYPTLYRYAESLSLETSFLSDNTQNVLLLAGQLAPQVGEISLSTANLLIRRGEFGRAEEMLAPLTTSAHRGRIAQTAAALLEKAQARDVTGLPPVFHVPEEAVDSED